MRRNILICAHELSPYQGSECAEGWNTVINLSKFHNLYVIYASGSQKSPLSYKDAIDDFKKYKSKIQYFFIENFPEHNGNNWIYENYQRNQIKLGLNNLNPNDLILISDVDEIPNLENKKFMNFDSTVFLQNMYYYKFNIKFLIYTLPNSPIS